MYIVDLYKRLWDTVYVIKKFRNRHRVINNTNCVKQNCLIVFWLHTRVRTNLIFT